MDGEEGARKSSNSWQHVMVKWMKMCCVQTGGGGKWLHLYCVDACDKELIWGWLFKINFIKWLYIFRLAFKAYLDPLWILSILKYFVVVTCSPTDFNIIISCRRKLPVACTITEKSRRIKRRRISSMLFNQRHGVSVCVSLETDCSDGCPSRRG